METIISTSTFYPSLEDTRCKLALEFIEATVKAGYPIVIVDASGEDVKKEMKKRGALVFPELHRGMGPARRQSFYHAAQILRFDKKQTDGIIFWIEPEKVDMARHILAVISPIINNKADIVIVKRNVQVMRTTYPPYQFESEMEANKAYCTATKREEFDPMSGPVAYRLYWAGKLLSFQPHIFGLPDDYIHHHLPIQVPNNRVVSVEVDFHYPEAQLREEARKENESIRQKRDYQRTILINAYNTLGKHFKPWEF